MEFDELSKAVSSIIKDDDSYKASRKLQLENWCGAFLPLFGTWGEKKLQFFLDILSNEECWEKADAIHGIKLNRRVVAKKMIESENWKGTSNPLDDFDRYQVACWCCLESEIKILFNRFKQKHEVEDGDSDALKKLARRMSGSWYTDAMMEFWSHYISGCISELDLKNQHPYVFGLYRAAISSNRRRVEAVEFFSDKIELLPEKDKVFIEIAAHAAKDSGYPDVFEFCLGKINLDKYPELLEKDFEENGHYGSLNRMKDVHNFNGFQELFDCVEIARVEGDDYYLWLKFMIEDCPECYLNKGVSVFKHIWEKEGFDDHRTFVLNKEMMDDSVFQGRFLVPLVEKGYMEQIWAILNKANPNQIKEFMDSKKHRICDILEARKDSASLDRFLAYVKPVDKELCQKSIPGSNILAQGDSASLDGNKFADEEPYQKDIPGPSGDLIEAKVEKMHGQSRIE